MKTRKCVSDDIVLRKSSKLCFLLLTVLILKFPNYTTLSSSKGERHLCLDNDLECENGGTCEVKHGVPHCVCPDGFEGVFCHFFNENLSTEDLNTTGNNIDKSAFLSLFR